MKSPPNPPPPRPFANPWCRPLRLTVAGALFLLSACSRPSTASVLPADARTYEMRGRIIEFAPGRETVTIAHDEVAGFMPAMEMPFYVKDPAVIVGTKPGDAVRFRFVVATRDSWIDRVAPIDAALLTQPKPERAGPPAAAGGKSARLREGDAMPAFQLVNQDGLTLTNDSFKGEPFILTFIFTRCPVPNFCPLMTSHFEELQRRMAGAGEARAKLMSISFDTEFDQPAVLKAYAEAHGANPSVWTVVTGGRAEMDKLTGAFSVYLKPEGGTISHGLATALVDSNGKIVGLWRGNGWSTDEVLAKLASLKSAESK